MRRLLTIFSLTTLSVLFSMSFADTLWDYQAVDDDGNGTHPLVGADPITENRVTVEGIALAGYDEILDPNVMYTAFIQDENSNKGGLQAWAGKFWYPSWRPLEYISFKAGDKLRINGLLANNRGKVFINDRHSAAPDTRFTVEIIDSPGMPDPVLIPSVSACNYFDQTRTGGGELYQTRWVMLHGVTVTSGVWSNNNTLEVSDGSGALPVLLSGQGDFDANPAPGSKINFIAIFDQEDLNFPYIDTYRLWVKKTVHTALALDWNSEVTNDITGVRAALIHKTVSSTGNGYFNVTDASGSITVNSNRVVAVGDEVSVQGIVNGNKEITADFFIKHSATALVSGTYNDANTTNINCNDYLAGRSYTWKILSSGENGVGTVGVNNSFSFSPNSSGVSDVCVKVNGALSVKISNVQLGGSVNVGNVAITLPDVMNDDIWDDFDLNELNGGFGETVTAGSGADFNCDGTYDDFDLNQINGGFGLTGECFGI